MKTALITLLLTSVSLYAAAQQPCNRPDLRVRSVVWDEATDRLIVRVKNHGTTNAPFFRIYADGETSSDARRNPLCQVVRTVSDLGPGRTRIRTFRFASASFRRPNTLSDVNQFRVFVDAKNDVAECAENNNILVQARPRL